jgi:hypothetical protein
MPMMINSEKCRKDAKDFTEEVAAACAKRTRAVSRRGAKIQCLRIQEIEDGRASAIRRLDVDVSYRVEDARVHIRVYTWSDRWLWIDARRASKSGWAWEVTLEGRYIDKRGARGVVEIIEKMIDAAWGAPEVVGARIRAMWSPYLATGRSEFSSAGFGSGP